LATNIAYPVRWHDATTVAYERGVRFFLELPPGHTLTDLASTAFLDARSIALSQMQIDSAVKLIKRQAEKCGDGKLPATKDDETTANGRQLTRLSFAIFITGYKRDNFIYSKPSR
jgi:acyl transferase domain-containing protein